MPTTPPAPVTRVAGVSLAAQPGVAAPPAPAFRCDCCGTERRREDPILCVICGEPALGDDWTP